MGRRRKTQNKTPKTTADHLARAVFDDLLPEDRQTLEDYGFDRAITTQEKCFLLGLYQGLIKIIGISPKTLHDWRIRGVLVDEIKAAFYKIPECSRGLYFPWFLQNQHIVALAGQPLSDKEMRDYGDVIFLLRAWRFTGGSESDSPEKVQAALARKPLHEQKCHALYSLLLSMWSPSPDLDLWVDFGFAACTSEGEERVLCGHYQRLINLCTFKEFCDAYHDRHLLALLRSKGIQVAHNPPLQDLLASDLPFGWNKSVWNLKSFVVRNASTDEDSGPILPVVADYGFVNCKNASERRQLKKVYKAFFINHHGDPLALHEACIRGNTYDFLSTIIQDLHGPKYPRLMKNHYPISPHLKIAGLTWAGDTHVHVGGAPRPSGSSFGDGQYGTFHVSFHPPGSAVPSGPSSADNQDGRAQTYETSHTPNPHADPRKVSSKSWSDCAHKYGTSHWHLPCSPPDPGVPIKLGENQGGGAQTYETTQAPNLHADPKISGESSSDGNGRKAQTYETTHAPIHADPKVSAKSSSDDIPGGRAQVHETTHVPIPHADPKPSGMSALDGNQGGSAHVDGPSHAPIPGAYPAPSSKSLLGDNQGGLTQTYGTVHGPNAPLYPDLSRDFPSGNTHDGRGQAHAQAPAQQVSPIVYFVLGAVFSSFLWIQARSF